MTRPSEIEKCRTYSLSGTEFDHCEFFIRANGKVGIRPVFVPAVFSESTVYKGRFLMDGQRCRCNACHRLIRRGYEFTEILTDATLHFGRCCLINHVDALQLDEGGDAQ